VFNFAGADFLVNVSVLFENFRSAPVLTNGGMPVGCNQRQKNPWTHFRYVQSIFSPFQCVHLAIVWAQQLPAWVTAINDAPTLTTVLQVRIPHFLDEKLC
jgi:hypothetical protein